RARRVAHRWARGGHRLPCRQQRDRGAAHRERGARHHHDGLRGLELDGAARAGRLHARLRRVDRVRRPPARHRPHPFAAARTRGGSGGGMNPATASLPTDMAEPIKIDIWSDIACPWCFIGKRRFEAGAAEAGVPVEIEYHSFELAPDTPVDFEGSEFEFLAQHKGIPVDTAKQMIERVTGIARTVGLDYDYDALQHTNTVKAHQLLHYAKLRGRQLEMKEALLSAYF